MGPQPVHDSLPTPAERPERDILIYDGDCRFCRGQMERLARWDRKGILSFLSLHDPVVAERWPELSHDELMAHMVLIEAGSGKKHRGAEVIRHLSCRLPQLWILAPWLWIPGSLPVWQFLYRRVARIRYLFGRTDSCDDGTCSIHFK